VWFCARFVQDVGFERDLEAGEKLVLIYYIAYTQLDSTAFIKLEVPT
jgi:hypothetical protein